MRRLYHSPPPSPHPGENAAEEGWKDDQSHGGRWLSKSVFWAHGATHDFTAAVAACAGPSQSESTDRRGIRTPTLAKELWQLKAAEGGRVGVPQVNGPWWAICAPPRPVHTDNPGWTRWAMKRGYEVGSGVWQGVPEGTGRGNGLI